MQKYSLRYQKKIISTLNFILYIVITLPTRFLVRLTLHHGQTFVCIYLEFIAVQTTTDVQYYVSKTDPITFNSKDKMITQVMRIKLIMPVNVECCDREINNSWCYHT